MKTRHHLSIILALILLTISGLSTYAQTKPIQAIVKGKTNIKLSEELGKALSSLNITIAGISPAKVQNETSSFPAFVNLSIPVSGGLLDPIASKAVLYHAVLYHDGGISLTGINTKVQLLNLAMDINTEKDLVATIAGVVIVNDRLISRIPLFTISLASTVVTAQGKINKLEAIDTKTSLTKEAAAALNGAFSTTGFVEGLNIGNLTSIGRTAVPDKKLQLTNEITLELDDKE